MTNTPSRREFLQVVAGAAAAAPTFLRAQAGGAPQNVAPNDRIRFAVLGMGIRAQQDVRSALRAPGVELSAAADVYDGRLTLAKELWGNQVSSTRERRCPTRNAAQVKRCTPDNPDRVRSGLCECRPCS